MYGWGGWLGGVGGWMEGFILNLLRKQKQKQKQNTEDLSVDPRRAGAFYAAVSSEQGCVILMMMMMMMIGWMNERVNRQSEKTTRNK
jgi:hypothetical protein